MSFKGSGSWSVHLSWGGPGEILGAPATHHRLPPTPGTRSHAAPGSGPHSSPSGSGLPMRTSSALLCWQGRGFWEATAASPAGGPVSAASSHSPAASGVWTVGYSFHSGLAARQLRDQVPCWAEGPSPGTRPQGPGSPVDPRWLQPNLRRYPLGLSEDPQTPSPPACP